MKFDGEKDRTGYQLALKDVEAEFDPLELAPAPNRDIRDWAFEAEAADLLGISKRALERRRGRGTGPPHHKRIGRAAYFLEDLDAWLAAGPKGIKSRKEPQG